MKLAEALEDRGSFRRFCGFSASEATPERTAFVRFRRELVRRRLEKPLFGEVVRQLDARGLTVRTGTLVDATMVRAASDDDAQVGWKAYGKDAPVKGYKAHVATDESGGIVRKVTVTEANRPDAEGMARLLDRHPGRVWADSAYDQGSNPGPHPAALRRSDDRAPAPPRRAAGDGGGQARLERGHSSGALPDREGLRHGQAKLRHGAGALYGRRRVSLQVHLTFLAYNIKRVAALLRAQSA